MKKILIATLSIFIVLLCLSSCDFQTTEVNYPLHIIDTANSIYSVEPDYQSGRYVPGTEIKFYANPITDVDLGMYVNGEFVCVQNSVKTDSGYIWEYTLIMPADETTVEFKVKDAQIPVTPVPVTPIPVTTVPPTMLPPEGNYALHVIDTANSIYAVEPDYQSGRYVPGTEIKFYANPITDVDLGMYVNGQFVCVQNSVKTDSGYIWEYTLIMPADETTVEFKVKDAPVTTEDTDSLGIKQFITANN